MPFLNTLLIMMSQTSCSRQLKRIISLNLCYEKRYLKKVTLEGHKLNSQSLTQVGQSIINFDLSNEFTVKCHMILFLFSSYLNS